MTADPRDLTALNALSRFGLGPRPGDMRRIASDPRGAVRAELMARDVALLPDPYLDTTQAAARAFIERKAVNRMRNGRELKGRYETITSMMQADGRLPAELPKPASAGKDGAGKGKGKEMASNDMAGGGTAGGGMAGGMASNEPADRDMSNDMGGGKKSAGKDKSMLDKANVERSPLPQEIDARFVRARTCDIGFVERWVAFWNNHFTVSQRGKRLVGWLAGPYEREAIRPHALGRFSDMLLAASRHPAMLVYLNNDASIGPNSRRGERAGKGINENHARELLELHTVGVDGGYVQADVTSFAKALTGWRMVRAIKDPNYGGFHFDAGAHEPGPQTVMGKVYKDDGQRQAEAILADLARKPATATHIARRIVTAFVSDDPPPALVDRLARRFRDTDGDLKEVALALISADEAWDAPRTKMRSAQEFVLAAARALQKPNFSALTTGLVALGQPMWQAPSPKGYSIVGRDWIAPDAQTNRLDLAVDLAQNEALDSDPNALASDLLGDVMSDETKTAVKRAGSREQALALLLMSPEMQRR